MTSDSPSAVDILDLLGGRFTDEIILADASNEEIFMLSFRREDDFLVEYRDGSVNQQFATTVDTVDQALTLYVLWHANDPAWKTVADWEPVAAFRPVFPRYRRSDS